MALSRTLHNALRASLSHTLGVVVVVLGSAGAALALPEGMVVTGGQLELQRQDANNALIQQGSQQAAADFNSFNIDAGQRLQILQPNASSTLLGRVTSGQLTEIHGRLDANGRVLLINPAGVLVGPGGVVNTAGFTATTLHVDHQRFLQGGLVELRNQPGADPTASVINRGTINVADGGFAALVAPRVVNEGVITARLGQIQLASGTAATLDISGDGLLSVALDPAVAGSITNKGSLRASVVRLGGGEAAVLAAATVYQGGLIEARSIDELSGGRITLEGEHISVRSGAVLDATGPAGGGQILVGGSWQNSDPSVRQATSTTIEAGAVLDASATASGNGGTVVAWSDIHNPISVTRVAGSLRAQGGPIGGDGGRIETSGYRLNVDGIQVDAGAALGRAGEWLLDPYNITINGTGGTTFTNPFTATADSTILSSDIAAALNGGNNVTISTGTGGSTDGGYIYINTSIQKTAINSASLSLLAAKKIKIDSTISLASGNLSLTTTDGDIDQVFGIDVAGNITMSASAITIDANLISSSGDISLIGNTGIRSNGSLTNGVTIAGSGVEVKTLATNLIPGATGSITVQGQGGIASTSSGTRGVYISAGAKVSAGGTGHVTLIGTGGTSSNYNRGSGVVISGSVQADGIAEVLTVGGNISITGIAGGAIGSTDNSGVLISSFGRLTAGGLGNVIINGTSPGTGGSNNAGVTISNSEPVAQTTPTAAITTNGGSITINATGATNEAAVLIRNAGRVSSGGSGNVTIVADSLVLDSNSSAAAGSITAGAAGDATVSLRPRSTGTLINLGGDDVLSGSPLTLGLTTSELARITAGTLTVGSASAGPITLSQALAMAAGSNLTLLSGGGVTFAAGLTTSAGGALRITISGAITQSAPLAIAGLTSLSTGAGNITLLNTGNQFGVVPLTISSTGLVQIYPCSATISCRNAEAMASEQAQQDVLTTNTGLSQATQVSAIQSQIGSYGVPAHPQRDPADYSSQHLSLGQGSLDFSANNASCSDAGGCNARAGPASSR